MPYHLWFSTAMEILFDFPGVSDEFLPCKIDSAEKLSIDTLQNFVLLVAKNRGFFDEKDNDQAKFINEFCPKFIDEFCPELRNWLDKNLLDNLEKSAISPSSISFTFAPHPLTRPIK